MIFILIKLFQNSKLDLFPTVKFVKQLFRTQIQKGWKGLLWNLIKYTMEACYSELVLAGFRVYLESILKTLILFFNAPLRKGLSQERHKKEG